MDSISPRSSGYLTRPEQQYETVKYMAAILGLSDDFVRDAIQVLLEKGELIGGVDVLEIPRRSGMDQAVRRHYRQFRIHRETGMAKLKRYLTPPLSKS